MLPPLNDNEKKQKLATDFEKILACSLARGRWFDLFLSLSVTTPVITPIMGISSPCIFGKVCFDMLKSIRFGDLAKLFSSSRRCYRVYLD